VSIAEWAVIIAIAVAVFSVGVSTVAILRCYFPPQRRDVRALRDEVEQLGDDNDRIHTRLNERAARENLAAARDRKGAKRSATEEAQEILRERLHAPADQPLDIEAQRAAYRKKAGLN
jgi:hypothetical protein